jgi:hypothetical protein
MELRKYQKEIAEQGLLILKEHKIVYYAMQPRTGKTIVSLETARNYGAKSVLFLTKLKAIPSIKKDYDAGLFNFEIEVLNYESIHKRINKNYDLIICDESHSFGAYPKPNKRAYDVKNVTHNLPIIFLSGTPTPESYSQIYHQLWVSDYGPFKFYKNFYAWAKNYVNVGLKYLYGGRTINDYSKAIEPLIKEDFAHLILTYSQKEAGFKTEIVEEVIYVDTPTPKLDYIRKILKNDLVYFDETLFFELIADTAVRLQQLDHQLSSGTVIDKDGKRTIISTFKADAVKKYFGEKKIAIFYKFQAEYELLKQVFPINTSSPEEFNNNPNLKVFLGQFISSREGTRLDNAEALIFFNIDFSSLSYFQAKERIMSFERKEPAKLYWFFSKNGIEKEIYKVVTNKKDYTLSYYLKHEGINKKRFREQSTSENNKIL